MKNAWFEEDLTLILKTTLILSSKTALMQQNLPFKKHGSREFAAPCTTHPAEPDALGNKSQTSSGRNGAIRRSGNVNVQNPNDQLAAGRTFRCPSVAFGVSGSEDSICGNLFHPQTPCAQASIFNYKLRMTNREPLSLPLSPLRSLRSLRAENPFSNYELRFTNW